VSTDFRHELMDMVYRGEISAEQAAAMLPRAGKPLPARSGEDVAVVGMSGRFPGADDVDEFWRLIEQQRSAIVDVRSRWPQIAELLDSASRSGHAYSHWGALMNSITDFDPAFFDLSPRQAQLMEPRQRLLLMEAWRAIEEAGYSRAELDGRNCGVFIGCEGSSDYFHDMRFDRMDGNVVLGHSNSVLAARLSYFMNLTGPTMSIDTACSSSLVAIHLACRSLLDGTCDMALTGGVTVMYSMADQLLQSDMGMLSPTGRCATFDVGADGFVPAEAAAVLVLKRLSDAVRDDDHIHGIIRATAINQDGKTNGITAPSALSQERLIRDAWRSGHADLSTMRYIEAHGTGTPLGDPIEVDALVRTYGGLSASGRIGVGSVKTNVGHAGAASGVMSMVKVLMAMRHGDIPASINLTEVNPRIRLEGSSLHIVRDLEPLYLDDGEATVAVSSFGYSGTNAHIIVESARHLATPVNGGGLEAPDLPLTLFLSAASEQALLDLCSAYDRWLATHGEGLDLLQLCIQSLVTRTQMRYRVAVEFTNLAELQDGLRCVDGSMITRAMRHVDAQDLVIVDRLIAAMKPPKGDRHGLARLMNRLVTTWSHGVDGDYLVLRAYTGRRLSLPTYRFSHATYELESDDLVAGEHVRALPTGADAPVSPRIRRTDDGSGFEFEMSGDDFYVRDHTHVVPAAVHLEMIVQGAAHLDPDRPVTSIRNVMLMRHVDVPAGETVTVRLDVARIADDRIRLVIGSGYGQDYGPCVAAEVVYGDRARATPPGVASHADAYPEPDAIAVGAYRDYLDQCNASVGPTFRGVRTLALGPDDALVHMDPNASGNDLSGFMLNPTLLDAGFSGAAIWVWAAHPEAHGIYVPFSLGRLDLVNPSLHPVAIRIHQARPATGGDVQTVGYNLDYLSDSGDVVWHIENFFLRRLASPTVDDPSDLGVLAVRETWRRNPGRASCASALVVLSTLDRLGQAREIVSANGGAHVLISVDGSWSPAHDDVVFLDDLTEDELAEALIPGVDSDLAVVALPMRPRVGGDPAPGQQTSCVLRVVRNLLKNQPNRITDVITTTYGDPAELALAGFLRTMHVENSCYRGHVLRADADDLVTAVCDELGNASASSEVQRRDGVRYELTPQIAPDFHVRPEAEDRIRGGAFLITGGTGALGMVLTRHLLDHGADVVIVSGRSHTVASRIAEPAMNAKSEYLQWDVSGTGLTAGVTADIRRILSKHGHDALTGVFHAAGVIHDGVIAAKDDDVFLATVAPKMWGTDHVIEVARACGAEFVLLFSSTAAALGNPGQSDYAYGNRYMDAVAANQDEASLPKIQSVNWTIWAGDTGMTVPKAQARLMEERFGIVPLPVDQGLSVLNAVVASGERRVTILYGHPMLMQKRLLATTEPEALVSMSLPAREDTDPALDAMLVADLREIVGVALRISPSEIDFDEDMARFGFDSISFSGLANTLNQKFSLDMTPAVFFKYSSLGELKDDMLAEYRQELESHYAQQEASDWTPSQLSDHGTGNVGQPAPAFAAARRSAGVQLADGAPLRPPDNEPIAIIGMSARLPGSDSIDEFWDHLMAGDDLISEIPADRWDWRAHYGDTSKDRTKTRFHHGGFMKRIDTFDPYFFGIAGVDAEVMDPQERMVLEESWHALEDAGIVPAALAGGETGVFVGVSTGDYQELLIRDAYPNMLTQTMIPNRVSFTLNLHGPSEVVDTACSSTLVALHRAASAIRSGRCEMALAGGVNVICSPGMYVTQGRMNMLSPDGRCKTFDAAADGYVRGEGCGIFVLKSLSAAERDHDRILGVIRGSAVNHGGAATNLFAPNEAAQVQVIRRAHEGIGIAPDEVAYIEAHGTGTVLGDPIEVNALIGAYRELYEAAGLRFDGDAADVYLGAVKTNTGHLEAAAAVPGLVKILRSFQAGFIPRNIHFTSMNPYLRLAGTPIKLANDPIAWGSITADPRRQRPVAAISSFGIGGVNCHLVLEAPPRDPDVSPVRAEGPFVLPVSARTESQLVDYVNEIRGFALAHMANDSGKNLFEQVSARCMQLLGVTSADELDMGVSLIDYGVSPTDLAGMDDGIVALDPRMTLADVAALPACSASHSQGSGADLLADVCETFRVGRTRFNNRVAFVVRDIKELVDQCGAHLAAEGTAGVLEPDPATPVERQARAWVAGDDSALQPIPGASRISAPCYPFEEQRFWYTDYQLDSGSAQGRATDAEDVCPTAGAQAVTSSVSMSEGGLGIRSRVLASLCHVLKIPAEQVADDEPFASYGLDSIKLIQFADELARQLNHDVDPVVLLDYPSLGTLAQYFEALEVVYSDAPHGQEIVATSGQTEMMPPPLGHGVILRLPELIVLHAAKEFDRQMMVSFWRELADGEIGHIDMVPCGPDGLEGMRRNGLCYVHCLTRDAKGRLAEAWVGGQGEETLLIINGIGVAPSFASPQIAGFAGGRRIVCLSMPGVGLTPMIDDLSLASLAEWVLSSLDALQIERFDVLGVSWGSLLATTLAWTAPKRVQRLVLESPNADMGEVENATNYVEDLATVMNADFAMATGSHDEAARLFTDAKCFELRAFLRWSDYFAVNSPSRHEVLSLLPEIHQPVLVITGDRDTITPARESDLVALYLKNARVHTVYGASHLPSATHPNEFNTVVTAFLCDPDAMLGFASGDQVHE